MGAILINVRENLYGGDFDKCGGDIDRGDLTSYPLFTCVRTKRSYFSVIFSLFCIVQIFYKKAKFWHLKKKNKS